MTVSEQIIQVLDALCEKFGIAIDWTNANVIPYIGTLCTKLVTWEIWTSVAWIVFWTALSIVGIILAIVLRNTLKDSIEYGSGLMIFVYTIFAAIWFITIVVIGAQIFDIIKCVTFPEMHVFEYIQGLLNSGK